MIARDVAQGANCLRDRGLLDLDTFSRQNIMYDTVNQRAVIIDVEQPSGFVVSSELSAVGIFKESINQLLRLAQLPRIE